VDFSNLFISLNRQRYVSLAEAQTAGAPTLNYGLFINNVIDFLIVAFIIFLLVRQINRMARQPENAPPPPVIKECPYCLSKIHAKATRCPNCTSELKVA
jgi:large conductance mechanosensitive channel